MLKALCLIGLYALTMASLYMRGIRVTPPWPFLVYVLLIVIPLAYVLTNVLFWVQERWNRGERWLPPLLVALGLGMVWLYQLVISGFLIILGLFFAILCIHFWRGRRDIFVPFLVGAPALVLGYATVWGLNYLLAHDTSDRIHDAGLLRMDLKAYGWLQGSPIEPEGMFPIVRNAVGFQMLENSYFYLFVVIFAVILIGSRKGHRIGAYLTTIFVTYFLALCIFYIYPAVGPCIYMQETFDAAWHGTTTHDCMKSMHHEYFALLEGGPLSGFGYFVAVPSLHCALAVLLLVMLRSSPAHFWFFLPINVLTFASTFLLGYHYLIDAPAAVLLVAAVLYPWRHSEAMPFLPNSQLDTMLPNTHTDRGLHSCSSAEFP